MDANQILTELKAKVANSNLPEEVLDQVKNDLTRIEIIIKANNYSLEVEREIEYVNLVCELPWKKSSQDILDLNRAKQVLDKNHYGMEGVKERILEYLSVLILNQQQHQIPKTPILAFVGLVGAGKTSIAYSIAEALGRQIVRIPFGGLGSALQLRGESRIKPEAEPGLIIKAFRRSGVKNPVILLDELDRVTAEARADIMGVLVELLDPEQNNAFLDHYLDMPFDLSQVMFIATANNTNNIATAVMDRLELIEMPFYTDEQKVVIAREYLLPKALENAALEKKIIEIDNKLWPEIVRPLGFDGGIRSLKRNIDTLVRKVAKQVVMGEKGPFVLTTENLKSYFGG